MLQKSLFNKKKNKKKYLIFILLFSFILIIINFFYPKKIFFEISENLNLFYIIPENKGGKKITNINKKSLNFNINQNQLGENVPKDLLFSIQIFTNTEYDKIINYLKNVVSKDESIYFEKDFYILELSTELVKEYFLVYKNFSNRDKALEYCNKYMKNIDNCYIINVQNFNK